MFLVIEHEARSIKTVSQVVKGEEEYNQEEFNKVEEFKVIDDLDVIKRAGERSSMIMGCTVQNWQRRRHMDRRITGQEGKISKNKPTTDTQRHADPDISVGCGRGCLRRGGPPRHLRRNREQSGDDSPGKRQDGGSRY